MCVRLVFASSPDNELLFRSREGDVVRLNVDTMEQRILVESKMFVSSVRPCIPYAHPTHSSSIRTQSLITLSVPVQETYKATKYQLSPDMQHVLLAYGVTPVSYG